MYFLKDWFKTKRSDHDVLGLDLGSKMIKWVVLGRAEKGIELKSYAVVTIPAGVMKAYTVNDVSGLAMALKQSTTEAGTVKNCLLALPDCLVSRKWIQMDKMANNGDLESAISLAVDTHVPYPLDALYFDYQIFSAYPAKEYLSILLAACRKEHVDVRLEAIHQATLIPRAVEMSSQALERAYGYLYPEEGRKRRLILLDVGASQLTFLFLYEEEKVESYSERIVNAPDNESLLLQVKRCIKRYCLAYPYYEFNTLFLIGSDSALLHHLGSELQELWGLNTQIFEENQYIQCAHHLNKDELMALFPSLFLSYGLALRSFVIDNE